MRVWKPTRTLGNWLALGLAFVVVQQSVLAATDDGKPLLRSRRTWNEFSSGNRVPSSRFQGWTLLLGAIGAAILVLEIVWTYRATVNALALGRTGARHSPGATIAGWLVPVVSLWFPYQAWSDLWRNSDPRAEPGSGWRRLPRGGPVVGWWLSRLVGGGVLLVGLFVVFGDVQPASIRGFLVVGHLALAASAALGVRVVRTVSGRQAAQREATPSPALVPAAITASGLPPAGWYHDPARRHQWRYWDGERWTRHASTDGVVSDDPLDGVPG